MIAPKSAMLGNTESSLERVPEEGTDQDPLVTFKHVSFKPNISAINKSLR